MKRWLRPAIALGLVLGLVPQVLAFEADGCEKQRVQYPKRWNDVAKEKTLFTCAALGKSGPRGLRVRLGASDSNGRTLISIAPLPAAKAGVYRIWLDREQTERLKRGEYFATILRMEDACWIRGVSDDAEVFFMDNAPAHPGDERSPRLSWLGNSAFRCERKKPSVSPVPAKSCEQQRAQFPKDWNDTSKDKPLFNCGFRGTFWRIKLCAPEAVGRSMLSVVRLRYLDQGKELREVSDDGVYRAWLDAEQAKRLAQGQYFATAVRPEDSCFADGSLKDGSLFFLDAADPPQDRPDAGNLYNKAPRFGVFGEPMHCAAVSDKP